MAQTNEYRFTDQVRSGCTIFAVLLGVLVLTIPVSIYFILKRNSGRLTIDDRGLDVAGLGLTQARWNFDDIERLGLYSVTLGGGGIGGGIARKMSGGRTAVNLLAKTRSGKTLKFMASRFERSQEIIDRVAAATGKPLETVSQGMTGLKWPKS